MKKGRAKSPANYDFKKDWIMMFLSFDPGDTTGWAHLGPEGFSKHLEPYRASMGQLKGQEALVRFLEGIQALPRVIIYEAFVIDGDMKKHKGQEHFTIQNIGIIKSYAIRNNIELVRQERTRKTMGYGWGQISKAGSHKDSHGKDAMAHAVYYVVTKNIRPVIRQK